MVRRLNTPINFSLIITTTLSTLFSLAHSYQSTNLPSHPRYLGPTPSTSSCISNWHLHLLSTLQLC
jgi:hypothetical protein